MLNGINNDGDCKNFKKKSEDMPFDVDCEATSDDSHVEVSVDVPLLDTTNRELSDESEEVQDPNQSVSATRVEINNKDNLCDDNCDICGLAGDFNCADKDRDVIVDIIIKAEILLLPWEGRPLRFEEAEEVWVKLKEILLKDWTSAVTFSNLSHGDHGSSDQAEETVSKAIRYILKCVILSNQTYFIFRKFLEKQQATTFLGLQCGPLLNLEGIGKNISKGEVLVRFSCLLKSLSRDDQNSIDWHLPYFPFRKESARHLA